MAFQVDCPASRSCDSCLRWGPEESVQNGKQTLKQVRYHHLGTLLKNMLNRQSEPLPSTPGVCTYGTGGDVSLPPGSHQAVRHGDSEKESLSIP